MTRAPKFVTLAALLGALFTSGAAATQVGASTGARRVSSAAPADTTITLTSSNLNAKYGAAGTITAKVRPVAPAKGVATGSVDFSIDGGWYWTAPLDTTGRATLALSDVYPAYYPGTYSITASYSGDASYNASTTAAPLLQTLIGITTEPVTTLTLNAQGVPVFSPRSFTMSSVNPVGCNVTIFNNTPNTVALAYGTPGAWKRLPRGGVIAPGGSAGVGVGMSQYTGYFTTTANTANYVAIHCK